MDVVTELDERLDEVAAIELEDRLDEVTATELDDGATELGAEDELAPPHTADVRVAPFLPTPATEANVSFTHCGDTGE